MPIVTTVYVSQNLNNLAGLVRGVLPNLIRKIIGALITLDVHSRDVVTQMVKNKVLVDLWLYLITSDYMYFRLQDLVILNG